MNTIRNTWLIGLLAVLTPHAATPAATIPDMPPVVDVSWLAERTVGKDLVVLHIGPRGSYEEGHVPGAAPISVRSLLAETPAGLRDEMPPREDLAAAFAAAGVGDDSRVVLCGADDQALPYVARVFLTLEYLGRAGRVAVLDGGLTAWRAADRPVTTGAWSGESSDGFAPRAGADVLIQAAALAERLQDPATTILDCRPAESYAGHGGHQVGPRAGHIPGAENLPFFDLTGDDGKLLPRDRLADLFAKAGYEPGRTIVTYCGTGIWASVDYLAARSLGYPVLFYDGSFQEWSGDERYEVVAPVDPGSVAR